MTAEPEADLAPPAKTGALVLIFPTQVPPELAAALKATAEELMPWVDVLVVGGAVAATFVPRS